MAIFKCKMCGGDLHIEETDKVVECDFCGTMQTLPSADNEKKLTLFNRANRLRLAGEFDKAAGIYENIVAEFSEEAEAYWGLCLCNYGIEYVDDPATGKKIPTCHRASFQKLREDENFELAMEYADVTAQKVYRDEAREIDRINEEILSVSRNESPYDVFICYKETDEAGERTPDSVMAQDIYDALIAKGLKVFFARISLEDKLGQQYEPYIFAALNSAKIMLCVGTRYEYFHAVWVKNEWSRFLRLAAKDKSKALIPCYKDMDPYDLPDAFKGLQAQDLGKLGAIQDLVRGVEKLLEKDAPGTPTEPAQTVVVNPAAATVEPLLKRVFMFLEDGNWQSANEYAEKVLDLDPENGEAYLAKAMAECNIRTRTDIAKSFWVFQNQNVQKVLRYGNDVIKNEVKQYLSDSEIAKKELVEKMRQERNKRVSLKHLIALKESIIGIKADGTVLLSHHVEKHGFSNNDHNAKSCDTSGWCNIVSVLAGTEYFDHTLNEYYFGLSADGTVKFTGKILHDIDKAVEWSNIVSLFIGNDCLLGLKSDGTVVAAGDSYTARFIYNVNVCVSDWRDIVDLSVSSRHVVGLKKDGTVVATGDNIYGECDVSNWQNMIKIATRGRSTYGLKNDGTVLAVGDNRKGACQTEEWVDIVDFAVGADHAVGLKADGTVVATGDNSRGQCEVSNWQNIVAVTCNITGSFGLRIDGTVVSTSWPDKKTWPGLSSWRNVVSFVAEYDRIVGIKSDGTVMIEEIYGNNKELPDVSDWKLFDNYETIEQERAVAREKARQEAERIAEQNRILAEQKRQKELEERQAAERERIAKLTALITSMQKEKAALEAELPTLKGIFKAGRRREVEERLEEIKVELKKLGG